MSLKFLIIYLTHYNGRYSLYIYQKDVWLLLIFLIINLTTVNVIDICKILQDFIKIIHVQKKITFNTMK